eukprot:8119147-Pyramimonas_sp.AAC.1
MSLLQVTCVIHKNAVLSSSGRAGDLDYSTSLGRVCHLERASASAFDFQDFPHSVLHLGQLL